VSKSRGNRTYVADSVRLRIDAKAEEANSVFRSRGRSRPVADLRADGDDIVGAREDEGRSA